MTATRLEIERLENREVPTATATLNVDTLNVAGGDGRDRIVIAREGAALVVRDSGRETGRFAAAAVAIINVDAGAGDDTVRLEADVTQTAVLIGGTGRNILKAGGGNTTLIGGDNSDKLSGGPRNDVLLGGGGRDRLIGRGAADFLDGGADADRIAALQAVDVILPDALDTISFQTETAPDPLAVPPAANSNKFLLQAAQVTALLNYASAVTPSQDGIIAIVDRNGTILGVRIEAGVDPAIMANPALRTFAIDGAVAKARTAAFFASNAAPLTSRTIEALSQTTITEREVNSNPNIKNVNSSLRGPGFVAPVHTGGHFPTGFANTPQVDLFAIQHTNRDSMIHPGQDHVKGTADDIPLSGRFNIDPKFVPAGQTLFAPESYGFQSGVFKDGQSRGIATLPGGIPLYFNDGTGPALVGGIGVFFPGKTGFATEENSSLGTTYDPNKPDRSLEAEYIALMAAGGAPGIQLPASPAGGLNPVAGFALPINFQNQRIDLVGITLDIIGPNGTEGPEKLVRFGQSLGSGVANGADQRVNPTGAAVFALDGKPVPEGWLVTPHDGVGITAAEADAIVRAGIIQADQTRAAIRLPLDTRTRMVFAVTDQEGKVVALFRQPDATVFSIDVAVAKARNVMYYADPNQLQAVDQVGVPPGTAFTNRTFRYLAEPFFPEGIDEAPPGPFSIINDGGVNQASSRQVGAPLPASAFQSVLGFDAFNPGSNFRQQSFIQNQNGIVFFPGSAPVYRQSSSELVGGFGISGDGVDQDDVVTFAGSTNFGVPNRFLRADETFVRGVRLPYQKFNRNPED